ncbi:chromosomal replication initiator protein DnaA [Corynebacterium sp. UMB9976]|uniref:chromosomal replication initiator protein DnaA n=1 Tax=Corynebacterium sp. UMB9976 TaxID=3046354 RepID=UPI00254E678C|nr:chromosomal replication initiator protein DnaA [Corynebacterium sp. UMB9976]MDK6302514.1 chromosomal replication initiator protein DnaA [Corynebacterium sp. UMB9976]
MSLTVTPDPGREEKGSRMTHAPDPADPTKFATIWHGLVDAWIEGDGTQFPPLSASSRSVLRQIQPVLFINGIAVMTTPNEWSKGVVEGALAEPIEKVLGDILQSPVTLSLSIREAEPEDATPPASANTAGNAAEQQAPVADSAAHTPAPSTPAAHSTTAPTPATPTAAEARAPQSTAPSQPSAPAESPQHDPKQDEHTRILAAERLAQQHQGANQPESRNEVFVPAEASSSPTADTDEGDRDSDTLLNKKYTFESFVIGGSNQFAHAACRAVAEAPARAYNPLFIWGESGLGKTHLLHAIGHYAKELQPDMRVRYVSSEELTNDFINSIANDRREEFKREYRNLDMLIVDDIQFLQGKESTQEEFFHTFNALHQANKQIVLSSDRPPRQLTTLEDRLRTRFEGGLITDVQTPDLETRMAILSRKAAAEGTTLPEDVLELIASRYETSIRELEGALIRVTAYCSLGKEPITKQAAEIALRDIMPVDDVQMTPQVIIDVVSSYFDLTVDELVGKGRTKRFVQARQIAMYLCRELTDLSLPKLGQAFGGRDHTTVMHAERRIREQLTEDRVTFNEVQELTQRAKAAARG